MDPKNIEKASGILEVLQTKASIFFNENPKAKNVFGTSDTFLFTNRKFANNHAQTLENTEVYPFKNANDINVESEEVTDEDSDDDDDSDDDKSPSGIAATQNIQK